MKLNRKNIAGMIEPCEKIGFTFMDDPDNRENCIVTLPPEWEIKESLPLHSSYLFDENKDYRGYIIYYESSGYSEIFLSTYYDIYDESAGKNTWVLYFGREDKKIHIAGTYRKDLSSGEQEQIRSKYRYDAEKWADENYPDWQDPTAYWGSQNIKIKNKS